MNADEPDEGDELPDDRLADDEQTSPSDDTERRVEELAEGFLNSLRSGGTESLEELVSQHPELAPHLETRLKLFRAIYRAARQSSGAGRAATSDTTAGFTADSSALQLERDVAVRIHCPHCGNRLQVIGYNIAEVTCGSCGSAVHIDSKKLHHIGSHLPPAMPKQLGHFRILQVLGEGGFGIVFLAEDLNLDNRPVALKIPRHGFFATLEEERRFMREARNTARLRHPNIAQVYEIAEDRNTPFIVSELIEGTTLRDLAHGNTLTHREVAELVIQVTEAVEFAHRNKIIHRDLKSSNVLVDYNRRAFVVDFGLSRRDDAELTVTIDGAVLGTVQYMSPEQAAGKQSAVGPWSDIYSMGVMLYELLCQQLPFQGSKQMVINQVIIEEPRSPRSLNENVPRDLETITLKAMAKNPKQRYESAAALGDDLRRWMRGEPIHARPVSGLVRGWSWCKRHPTTAGLSACIIALLLAGTTISILWAIDQTQLTLAANTARAESDTRQYELLMQNGSLALEDHELAQAGLWFSEALAVKDNAINRTRIGMIQDQTPKLVQLWSTGEPINGLLFAADRLAVFSWEGQVQVYDLLSRQAILTQSLDPFSHFDFSSSGKTLAVCGQDHHAQLWDVERRQLIGYLAHEDLVVSTDFHQSEQLIATGGFDSFARVWNTTDGALVAEHQFDGMRVNRVAFVPDSELVVVVTQQDNLANTMHLWNYTEDRIVASGMEHAEHIMTLDFAEQGEQICSASRDGEVRIWERDSGEPVGEPFKLPFAPMRVMFGGSSSELVSITYDYDVQLWDIATGRRVGPQIRNQNGFAAASQNPLNRLLALAGTDGTVKVYWRKTGALACSILRNSENALSVAFHPDGRRLAIGGSNGVLQLWDLAGAAAESHVFEHEGSVRNAIFSPDGQRCLTIGLGGKGFIWDADTGERMGATMEHSDGIAECALSRDGKVFATASNDQSVKLWDAFSGRQLGATLSHDASVATLDFSPNGEQLITGCIDGSVTCWGIQQVMLAGADPEAVQPVFTGKHESRITSVTYSPQGDLAASASLDGVIRCWNTDTGNQEYGPFKHPKTYFCLFLPNGLELLSCGTDGFANVWTIATGEISHRLPCAGTVRSARVFNVGKGLLTNETKGRTRIWQRSEDQITLAAAVQHPSLESVYFSDMHPDFPFLAFAGGSLAVGAEIPKAGAAVLWETEEQRMLGPPLKHLAPVRRIYFDPTGKKLLTASADHTARLWELVSNQLPCQDAIRIARLYAQQKRDSVGRLTSVSPQEQISEFTALSARYPAFFRCSSKEVQLWSDDARRLHTSQAAHQTESDEDVD